MHSQTQTRTQSMQTCVPSHPARTRHTQRRKCTHTRIPSHTHMHILGHKKYRKMHTHKHTCIYTQTHRHPSTHAHSDRHTDTPAHTHGRTPTRGRQGQPDRALRHAMLACLHSRVFFAAFPSPRPPCLQDLIRFRPGGRGPTLFKITAMTPANRVKWNLRPQGNPLIQL